MIIIIERWKKRPTKKVNKRSRPLETHVWQGRLAQHKNVCWPKLGSHPTEFRFDRWTMSRAACRTRSGCRKYPNRDKTAQITPIRFYVGVISPPLYCIDLNFGPNEPCKKSLSSLRVVYELVVYTLVVFRISSAGSPRVLGSTITRIINFSARRLPSPSPQVRGRVPRR